MKEIFITGDNIISSLGFSSEENFQTLRSGQTGIRKVNDPALSPFDVQLSQIDTLLLEEKFAGMLHGLGRESSPGHFTRLEKMMILSVYLAVSPLGLDLKSNRMVFILSTTKGNIQLLEERYRLVFDHKRLYLWELARVVGSFFGFSVPPVIVSNACISGVAAIILGTRYIRSGAFSHAIITGGDVLSEFVISGFHSFQSLSPEPCKPYDIARDGLSLGEACGTMVLADTPANMKPVIKVLEGSVTNDANHISGPSRTGEELGLAMKSAMAGSRLLPEEIGLISAHGTATPYNDEMESKAIAFAGLGNVPVNSLKGYWGHTLGAAGVIESVASVHSLMTDTLIGTAGFRTSGVTEPIQVVRETTQIPVRTCLKTASGFGGCNAAVIFQKE